MPVLGVQFKTLEGRRYQDVSGPQQVRVDHNSTFTSVQQDAQGNLRIDFAFTTSYGAIGMVKVEGTLAYKVDDAAAILEKWGKDRALPEANAQEVHSAILASAIPEVVGLAKGIRLPPPIPIPQVRFQGQASATATERVEGPDAA